MKNATSNLKEWHTFLEKKQTKNKQAPTKNKINKQKRQNKKWWNPENIIQDYFLDMTELWETDEWAIWKFVRSK